MSKLIQYGLVGGALAVGYVGMTVDKAMNYIEVSAEVLSIEESCYLEKDEGKTRRFTDPMDCKAAGALRESHPAYEGFRMVRDATVKVYYPDPAAHEYRTLPLELSRYKDYPDFKPGDMMQILAHKKEPGKIREL